MTRPLRILYALFLHAILCHAILPGPLLAATIVVPTQAAAIQAAINAAKNGDTVLVERGTYMENINFRGKAIIVASRYLLTGNPEDITGTIINGSTPVHPDSASCVIFGNHEDTTSVLDGFTLTGGTGTIWLDIHNQNIYREGGGVLSDVASPTIRNNYIHHNSATDTNGVTSCGGGGIRCGDGNPRILNNVIMYNAGRYGGGIVLNYTGAIIRNNVVAKNTGGEDFGGSGIWAFADGTALKIVENNTVLGNVSAKNGGGFYVGRTSMIIKNNIIWGNTAKVDPQISLPVAGSATVSFCDVQDGFAGNGNFSADPLIEKASATLNASSPCIDAGDPERAYADRENSKTPGMAAWPSHGTLRNDVGAYGGRGTLQPISFTLDAQGLVLPGR